MRRFGLDSYGCGHGLVGGAGGGGGVVNAVMNYLVSNSSEVVVY